MHGHRRVSEDQAKDFSKAIKQIFVYSKKYNVLIVIALLLSGLSSVLAIIGPDKLKEITNIITAGLMTGIDMDAVKHVAIILLVLYLLSFIFNYSQGYIMATVTNRFSKRMRKDIAIKINKLPLSYFDNTTIGDILSRVTNDVDTICMALNHSLGAIVSAITMFVGSIIMMFYTNYILAITAILSSIIGFVLMIIIMSRSQKYFNSFQNGLGDINGHIEEVFTGHNIIKVYNATEEMDKEFDRINEQLFQDGLKSQFYSGLMQPIMHFIGNFGYVMVCIIGALLAMKGIISFGVIVAFMIYVRLFTNPLSEFASGFTEFQATAAASERVFEFLDVPEMPLEEDFVKLDKKSIKGNLEFKDVSFSYNKKKKVIKNFSASVKSGEKVAIVGPTGAGKTTIVNLLMKFYDIDDGDILIDGTSIKNITRENVHELFTMVLQDTWLFNGTIKDNIIYNQKNATLADVKKACKIIGLDHYIETLPKGYDSLLSDNDSTSAGQKQLLTIARSMINDTPFIILDEATSSVDTRTEELVAKAMDKLTKGKTSFIIAHRLSTIRNADLILVIKNGNIVEQGKHEDLLKQNGFYAELYNSQFQEIN